MAKFLENRHISNLINMSCKVPNLNLKLYSSATISWQLKLNGVRVVVQQF